MDTLLSILKIMCTIEMETALKSSNQNVKNTTTLEYIFDIKNWIAPHLDEIHGHTAPHIFRFRLNHSKRAEMHYKNWTHESWEPSDTSDDGLLLLKVCYLSLIHYSRKLVINA